ncbi:unnamed protein product [Diamesa serratosioi]
MIHNDYIISSNNSINENKYNNQKMKMSSRSIIKSLIKPIINIIKQNNNKTKAMKTKKNKTQKTVCDCQNNHHTAMYDDIYNETSEIDNNSFNEELEYRIIDEIKNCQDNAAMYVYGEDDNCSMTPVFKSRILDEIRGCDDCCHTFVPVHFARTDAGTFFWTANYQNTDNEIITDNDFNAGLQLPQLQAHSYDRWIQA